VNNADDQQTAALATLLELEYAVVYGLAAGAGQLAPRATAGTTIADAVAKTTASYDQHQLRRDRLIAALSARGATVPDPLPAYRVTRSDQPTLLLSFLAELGRSTISGYRSGLGSLTDTGLRADAVAAVIEASRYRTAMLLAAGQTADAAAPALPS
jgi:hypothetical protein